MELSGKHWVGAVMGSMMLSMASGVDSAGNEVVMDEIVISATRDSKTSLEVPFSTALIDEEEILIEMVPRTLPETLRYQPSVLVQKTAHGQGSPFIRGFTAYRNLLLIDGVRLNNSVFRDGPNQYWGTIDIYSVSRMELVRGPGSALYGSDAIGGTLSVFTRGSQDMRPDRNWDSRLYTRISSAEESFTGRLETMGRLTDQLTMTLGVTAKDYGELEGGREVGTQKTTDYDEFDWDVKFEYAFTPDRTLVLAHQGVQLNDAWRTHKTIYGIDWEGLSVGSEFSRILDQ